MSPGVAAAVALAALALGAVVLFAVGVASIGRGRRGALEAVRRLSVDDVEALARECAATCRDRLGVTLDETDLEGSAERIDRLARDERVKEAFATPELRWRFVLPLGAYLGEVVRRHGKATWQQGDEGPVLLVALGERPPLVARPFEKIVRHRGGGRPGDLAAYTLFASGRDPLGAPTTAGDAPGAPPHSP